MSAPMAAHCVAPAPYLPFLDRHKGAAPGLFALPPEEWIEIDAAYAPQMALRDRLIAERGAAVATALPEARGAVAELWAMLSAHALARFGGAGGFRREGAEIARPDGGRVAAEGGGVGALGRLVQEDFLLLTPGADGAPRLTAAALCFPSRWALGEKLGRPLDEIHAPAPGYAGRLSAGVDRVFAALHPERPLQRLNFGVIDTDALHLPDARARAPLAPGADPATLQSWLRVERQTLRRLPETRAAVFSVKTYLTPVAALAPGAAAALRAHVAALSPAEIAYRGGAARQRAALAALARRAAAADAQPD